MQTRTQAKEHKTRHNSELEQTFGELLLSVVERERSRWAFSVERDPSGRALPYNGGVPEQAKRHEGERRRGAESTELQKRNERNRLVFCIHFSPSFHSPLHITYYTKVSLSEDFFRIRFVSWSDHTDQGLRQLPP